MSVVVKDEGKNFEACPTGMQPAVCCAVHDLGMQEGFAGKLTHKVAIVFELEERMTEGDFAGQRFIRTKTYTASLNERSNLSKDLESWRGITFTPEQREGFDLEKVIGANCNLNLVEKTGKNSGNTYVNIASINPLAKGQKKLKPENPGYMPKWIATLLDREASNGIPSPDDFDDDIPF